MASGGGLGTGRKRPQNPPRPIIAFSRLSDSREDAKEKGTLKVGRAGKKKRWAVSSRFIFVFALSQFSGPDYLRAWNRLDL